MLGTRSPLASLRRGHSSGGCFALLPDERAPQGLQTAPMSPRQSAVGQSDVLAQGIGLREPFAPDILSQNVRLTNLTNALPNEDPHSPVPPTTRDVEQSQQCPEQPPNSLEKRPPLLQGRLLRPALPRCPDRWPFRVWRGNRHWMIHQFITIPSLWLDRDRLDDPSATSWEF